MMRNDKFVGFSAAALTAVSTFYGVLASFGLTPFSLFVAIGGAMCIGVLGYIVAQLLMSSYRLTDLDRADNSKRNDVPKIAHEEFTGLEGLTGIDVEDFKKTILDARAKLNAILDSSVRLNDADKLAIVRSIVRTGHSIIEEIKKDPQDYRLARSWFNIYLDQTKSIMDKYLEIMQKQSTPSITKLRADMRDTLVELDVNFKQLLDRLYANDVESLQVDLEVLKEQLKVENR